MGIGLDPLVMQPGDPATGLRPMEIADLDRVAAIEAASARRPWSREAFRHELGIPFSRAMVATLGSSGEVAGFAVWWRITGEAHLLNLAVEASRRRAGLGRLLLTAVLREATEQADSAVVLEVAEVNAPALGLYRSAGFAVVGRRPDYYGPGLDALLMKWVPTLP